MLFYQHCLCFSTIKKMQICPENMEIKREKREAEEGTMQGRLMKEILPRFCKSSLSILPTHFLPSLTLIVTTTPTPAYKYTQAQTHTRKQGRQNGAEQRGKRG